MTPRRKSGTILAWSTAVGFIATAGLHSTGYDSVTRMALQMPEEIRPLIPALWLSFSIDLVVLGLIIGVVARRPGGAGRIVVALAAICPFAAAGLQLLFIGFVPPTAILLALGSATVVAAWLLPDGGPELTGTGS